MVVPFPPGGPTDVVGRIAGERMARALGQSVIIENASGAGGTIGTAKVARAPADGYTICVGQLNSHVFGTAVYNTPYNVLDDFEPVGVISISALLLGGRGDLPAANVRELAAWLKALPQPSPFATIGAGSPPHVWAIGFANQTGARFQYVPYRGGAPAIQDMLAGRIDLSVLEASSLLPHVQCGQAEGLRPAQPDAVEGGARRADLGRAGLPGLRDAVLDRAVRAQGRRPRDRSSGSTPRWSKAWPIRRSSSASARWGRKFPRLPSRRRRRLPRAIAPTSKSGGR